ncbi:MAG TPA: DUF1707 domain-containing protein [Streptosporangiaceae bacterium]|nr:DUF1707 domain-containing protein [Streptosporangiaceae bacterium]
MPTDDAIRASDADREHAVGLLRDGYACGRLTLDEFDERTTAAFASRTWGELRKLTQDLPAPGQRPPLPAAPAALQQSRESGDRPPRAVPACDSPALVPVLTIALFWLALTFTAHAAGALIPVVLIVLMAVQMAGRVRCGLGSVDRPPPDQPPPPGGGPEAR